MLLVNARAGPSTIHGIGLIAHEFISTGKPVWQFREGFDIELTEQEFLMLSVPARLQVRYYAAFLPDRRLFVLSSDDDRFTNHSTNPNTRFLAKQHSVTEVTSSAMKDVQVEHGTWALPGSQTGAAHRHCRLTTDMVVAVRDIAVGDEITFDYLELGWSEFIGMPARYADLAPPPSEESSSQCIGHRCHNRVGM